MAYNDCLPSVNSTKYYVKGCVNTCIHVRLMFVLTAPCTQVLMSEHVASGRISESV